MTMKNKFIQVQFEIGTQVDYLDATIQLVNNDDDPRVLLLETRVHHETKAEPYALPYVYDYTSYMEFSKLIRVALIRAALCCSDIDQFQQERQYIELSFTMNQFHTRYIHKHVAAFFMEFNVETFDAGTEDPMMYNQLRANVIDYDQKRQRRSINEHHEPTNPPCLPSSKRFSMSKLMRSYRQRHRIRPSNVRKLFN
ncbi:unnamed protein product [Rotaria sp. Silwood2]|nr:unnamed protein product [Rotaria sp. Silwood2]CAF2935980.1 unnamed protein product [Rotaria sp. Silwood2]CAF3314399.1 unnamed protein product [Rotaria sp. Silwood2]CAF3902969.1 unnamed protein product [Rotaria sp. Silwood2]CAF3989693.1 unnamed protein product [Rotaria sp. Silwood2]